MLSVRPRCGPNLLMDYPIQPRHEIEAKGAADARRGRPNPYLPGSDHAEAWQKGAEKFEQEKRQ